MNAKAQLLGMSDTRYVEPTGLSSGNQSSATDLARLVGAAYNHPILRELSTSREAQVDVGHRQLQFRSTNGLVRNPEWDIGLQKTGYISEAGRCLVMQAATGRSQVDHGAARLRREVLAHRRRRTHSQVARHHRAAGGIVEPAVALSPAWARRRGALQPRWPNVTEICAAVALTRSSQASSSRSAGAEIDRPATSLPWSSKMPAAMQRTPISSSSSSRAQPEPAHVGQFAFQRRQFGDAVARLPGQTGARGIGAHALRVVQRQEQLAHRGQVQRRAAADGAHHLHARVLAVGALDVDDLVALAHRQIDGLVRQPVQLAHRAERCFAHIQPGLDQVAQFQQAHAQPVAAGMRPIDEAADGQVVQNPVRRRRMQRCLRCDLLQDTGSWCEASTLKSAKLRSRT